jgi:hypothetical protein
MFKKFLLGVGLSLSAVTLLQAAPVADNLLPERPAIARLEDRSTFTGTFKELPGGKLVLETLEKTHDLEFASRTASREARKLVGMRVKVVVTERKADLMVHSSSPVVVSCRKGIDS